MDIEDTIRDKSAKLIKRDLFGAYESGKSEFDHVEEMEPVGLYLPSCSIDTLNFWFQRTDAQNIALQGLHVTFRKVCGDSYFESFQALPEPLKVSDKDWDVINLDPAEYIKTLKVRIADANGKIGGFEFITTKKNRKILCCGDPNNTQEDDAGNTKNITLPPGTDKVFDFTGDNGYLVGFYGQYDENYVTHLGAYVATYSQIDYYTRRPYILLYKQLQKKKEDVSKQIMTKLGLRRVGEGEDKDKIDGAKINDSSKKVLFYLMDASLDYSDLFKSVLEYLY